jgi:chromosome segregation ATPase
MKQKEMDQMAQKLTLPVDTDILRMKIQKDLEARHRVDIETKVQENERLSDQFYECKRQLDILRT